MTDQPTTRTNADGYRGDYPSYDDDWVIQLYRDNGMEPPWLLEWEDGHPVLDENGRPKLAERTPQPPVGRSPRYWRPE